MGEMVEFAGPAGTASGYLALPVGGVGPGVVVIQEWWGLVDHIRDVCDRFAEEGFAALAPDLYHGVTTREPDEAGKQMMNLRLDQAAAEIGAAARHLLDSGSASGGRVGVVGFCMGGGLALHAAVQDPQIAACVSFYGVGPGRDSLNPARAGLAVLGHWGERDNGYDRASIAQLEEQLAAAGISVVSHWYDADHAFFNDTRPEVHDPASADRAWERTLAFLRAHLGGAAPAEPPAAA